MKQITKTNNFSDIVSLINQSRLKAYQAVNRELIELYWKIGEYISNKTSEEGWGKSTVQNLSAYIQNAEPGIKGFSDKNLWRMKQFYEVYRDYPKLSALLREITWTNHVMILSKCGTIEEKEFYLQLIVNEHYTSRELERQIKSCYYERTLLGQQHHEKLSALLREFPKEVIKAFKDHYVFDFLKGVGVLLCKGKDNEVVEYAISRQMSPTLISEYEMAMPDKKLLQEKLREICR